MSIPTPKLLFFFFVFFVPVSALSSTGENETQFIYTGFQGVNLTVEGIASIQPNGLVQLTNFGSEHKAGHVFHPEPVSFNKSLSFSLSFVFAIYPDPSVPNVGTQGMTFLISPSTNFSNAIPDEYLGLLNFSSNNMSTNHLFAIELDTIQNPAFADINGNHVGIDINSLLSTTAAPASYYSETEKKNETLNLQSTQPMQVWVDYAETEMLVNVTIAPLNVPKPSRNLLSARVNLSNVFQDSMYIGFSASTGIVTSQHYVLGWSWNQSGPAQSLDPSKLPSLPKRNTSKKRLGAGYVALLMVISLLLVVMLVSGYVIRRRKYQEVKEAWEKEYAPHRISYKDLYKATKGFKSSELLGEGGFGKVYKGTLRRDGNRQVAVKRVSHQSQQGMKEFVAEIVSMRRLRHRNLVQLLGYCRRKEELFLVYEFMPNGSLDKFLFGNIKPTLPWKQRLKIIRGVAASLLYLHEGWEQVVLHRDIKSSNVLLDAQMNPKLGDFGLARLYDHGANPRTTHIVGTVGYLAPEFARTGKATISNDVFAFGIFTLEVACGKRPFELGRNGGVEEDEGLVNWVYNLWQRDTILEASDHSLGRNYDPGEMEMVLKIGLLCSHSNPEARLTMRQVLQILDGTEALPEIPPDLGDMGSEREGFEMTGESWGRSSPFQTSSFERGKPGSMSSCDSILQMGR